MKVDPDDLPRQEELADNLLISLSKVLTWSIIIDIYINLWLLIKYEFFFQKQLLIVTIWKSSFILLKGYKI